MNFGPRTLAYLIVVILLIAIFSVRKLLLFSTGKLTEAKITQVEPVTGRKKFLMNSPPEFKIFYTYQVEQTSYYNYDTFDAQEIRTMFHCNDSYPLFCIDSK